MSERIEKGVRLRATRSRMWRAIADPVEFGTWFGVTLHGAFVEGETVRCTFEGLPPPEAFDEMQRAKGLDPVPFPPPPPNDVFCIVERVQPEALLSFRWFPFGVDAAKEPDAWTRVEFVLDAADGGTVLTIRESGFERVPGRVRRHAFVMNDQGWTEQAANIARHVDQAA